MRRPGDDFLDPPHGGPVERKPRFSLEGERTDHLTVHRDFHRAAHHANCLDSPLLRPSKSDEGPSRLVLDEVVHSGDRERDLTPLGSEDETLLDQLVPGHRQVGRPGSPHVGRDVTDRCRAVSA